jgi:hypothetical protein
VKRRVCFQSDSEDDVEFDTIFNPMPAMEGLLLVFILIVVMIWIFSHSGATSTSVSSTRGFIDACCFGVCGGGSAAATA